MIVWAFFSLGRLTAISASGPGPRAAGEASEAQVRIEGGEKSGEKRDKVNTKGTGGGEREREGGAGGGRC